MNHPDMPLNAKIRIVPKTEPNPLKLDVDPEKLVEVALSNRMETIQLELQLAIEELSLELRRNEILPDLRMNYSYDARTGADDIGHAFSDFENKTSDTHLVNLSASIPIGNRTAKARLEQARLRQLQSQTDYANYRQSIRQEVSDRVRDLNNSWRNILAAEQNVAASFRTYKVEQSQFQIGAQTSTQVLRSAADLAAAQLSRINALAGYEIAQIRLAKATGTLLGYGKIVLEPTDI